MRSTRLVSIVIPAYKATYFEAALSSALLQNYDEIEIVIGDDCPDDCIAGVVEKLAAKSRWPIRYLRNQLGLGEIGNVTRCVAEARGEYIKFLYDDDVIVPDCVRLLVDTLENTPGVSLVSSRRRLIGEDGEFLPDIPATCFPFEHDTLLNGGDVVSFWGDYTVNFVGEPSSVLCRRKDLLAFGDGIFSLDEQEIDWVGDLAIYAKLLRQGNLAMLARPLSYFRISKEQYSQQARDNQAVGIEWHKKFKGLLRQLGWVRDSEANGVIHVAALTDPGKFRKHDLLAHLASTAARNSAAQQVQEWLARRVPSDIEMRLIRQRLEARNGGPRFLIVLSDPEGQLGQVMATLRSLEQSSPVFEWVRVVVLSASAERPESQLADRLVWRTTSPTERVAAINGLIGELEFDWLLLADAGTEFTASGLLMVALELLGNHQCRALYADELHRGGGESLGIALRPDFNLDLLLSFPASMARRWLFHRDALIDSNGFDTDCPDIAEFDLILRLIERDGIAGLGHVAEPICTVEAPLMLDHAEERQRIQRHLEVRGYVSALVDSALPGRYHIRYGHCERPLVSIIIPTKDQLPILQRCVESLLEKTRYPNYEVLIVDNDSQTAEAQTWLAGVESWGESLVRVLRYPYPFNYSAINNMAAQAARGEYLVLLNNDTAILREDWLDAMLNHAQRPEVGVVGAKLLYPDGRIQHAGVVLGLRGPADHPFIGEAMDAPGYMQRLQVDQNYSAVTAACLMIRKSLYEEVGGLDEQAFKVSYNDVDLCLKTREAGYLTVWTPHAVVMHEGSVSQTRVDPAAQEAKRKRFVAEQDAMYAKWLPLIAADPAYNRNLSLSGAGFALEADSQLTWRPLDSWRPLPVVLAHPADPWGCGNYRVIKPFGAMRDAGLIDGMLSDGLLQVADLARYDPDVLVLQRQLGDERLEAMRRIKMLSRAFKVYELDDYLPNLPMKSLHREHMPRDVLKSLRKGLGFVDRFVVSTEALADAFSGLHADIRVIENRLPREWWQNLTSQRRRGRKPRVGWAGGVSHTGDLELIADVVNELAGEVEWVFMGMCPDRIRPYVQEVHAGVDINAYPAALASLDLDLALAPVEQNLFNECKSNLRLLEYGACGFPVVCSDLRCYEGELPVTRVKNRFKDWVDAIRMHVNDLDASARQGDALRAAVMRDWMLEGGNLELWRRAWLPD
ncbi:glycosyltransferase [Ectopseudomonas chengduensis]